MKHIKTSHLQRFILAKILKALQLENFLPVNLPIKLESIYQNSLETIAVKSLLLGHFAIN